ncbi:MAG: DUF1425 domain-containing protein [bacterium]
MMVFMRCRAIFFALFLLSGCKTTMPSASTQEAAAPLPAAVASASEKPPFELLNKDLSRTFAVNPRVAVQRNEKGLLVLSLEMKNVTKNEVIYVQVKTLWLDKNGKEIEPSDEWQNMGFIPGQTDFYVKTALSTEAASFKVQIRYLPPAS